MMQDAKASALSARGLAEGGDVGPRGQRSSRSTAIVSGRRRRYTLALVPAVPDVEISALLGRGTHFEGKLHFEGRVRIDGSFRGEIKSDGVLVVGEGAQIQAQVAARVVIVKGGSVEGNIVAAEAIELYVPAEVRGDLRAPEVFLDKGVQFSGKCTIDK